MTDILGAISASLDLAIFITKQVEKIIDAPKTVRVMTDDVARLGRILSQLRDTLEPDLGAGHTAIRLKPAGLRNGLESVRRCEHALEKLEDALTNIFGNGPWSRLKAELRNDDWDNVEPIRFGKRARAIFAIREGDILKLMAELKECKWDIMLSNSVNQLYLAQQYPQLHAQDSEKLDYLQMLCESIAMQKLERQKSDAAAQPPPYKPLNPMEVIFNTNAVHIPGGDKGLEPSFPPKQPVDPPPQAHDLAAGNFLRRVHRSDIEEHVLNVERIRWLNDPFEKDFINIHESMSEKRLRELLKLSIQYRVSKTKSSVQLCEVVEEVAERTSELEEEIAARREEEQSLAENLRAAAARPRTEQEKRMRRITSSSASRSSSESEAEPSNDLVADLINQWIISPEEASEPSVVMVPETSECERRFRKGDRMYSCPVCGFNDRKVFCSDCFNKADHEGHGAEVATATGDRSFCDCGHLDAVKRRMTCQMHGTMDPESYKERHR